MTKVVTCYKSKGVVVVDTGGVNLKMTKGWEPSGTRAGALHARIQSLRPWRGRIWMIQKLSLERWTASHRNNAPCESSMSLPKN